MLRVEKQAYDKYFRDCKIQSTKVSLIENFTIKKFRLTFSDFFFNNFFLKFQPFYLNVHMSFCLACINNNVPFELHML